ncbi:MAG: radical SAM protein [candidate division NC10 bacterium]|nr:radical SAM protein [candidate division NC10 bacterium]MDE2322137.1 radical SAM protein [candidate division NC10 bacterium]
MTRDTRRHRLVKEDLVYGPLHSRRLGRSLGVNLLGAGAKLCSFNCRYCQCGWTVHPILKPTEQSAELPSAQKVTDALETKLQQLRREQIPIDVITFSGNGEPTLHPELEAIVKAAADLRDLYTPYAKLAILSNSSTVHRPEVRAALLRIDLKLMKLDAGSETLVRRINLPAPGWDFGTMLQGLAELDGVLLQTMFVWGRVANTAPLAIREWSDRVGEICPRGVHIYTLDRVPADPGLTPVSRGVLESIAGYARRRAHVPIEVY